MPSRVSRHAVMVIVALIIFSGTGFAVTAARSQPASASAPANLNAKAPRVAHIVMDGKVSEGPPGFSLFGDVGEQKMIAAWLQRLAKARNDAAVKAVALEIRDLEVSWAQAHELAEAVSRLAQEKPVYAYLTSVERHEYLVASAATQVTMDGAGQLEIVGLAAEMMFFGKTLEQVGVKPQMVQVGRFKGAAEPMTGTGPSQEMQQELNALLDDLFDQLCGQIAAYRDMDASMVRSAIDEGPLSADDAKRLNLVDNLMEQPQWRSAIDDDLSADATSVWLDDYGLKKISMGDVSNPLALLSTILKERQEQDTEGPAIAIIYATGVITQGETGEGMFGEPTAGAQSLVEEFRKAASSDRIKAVVFRIDSPGGSALASELIYQAVRDCATKKPVVASVGDLGASGGYYIAMGAPTVMADPTAVIGSIGVVSGKFPMTGLLDKLGISTYAITRGKNAGMELLRPWTPQEQQRVRELALHTYDLFVRRVKQSRGEKIADIDTLAQGRIFTARQAAANGLIDQVGGLADAITAARKASGLTSSTVLHLPRPRTLGDVLFGPSGAKMAPCLSTNTPIQQALLRELGVSRGIGYLAMFWKLSEHENALVALPYYLEVGN